MNKEILTIKEAFNFDWQAEKDEEPVVLPNCYQDLSFFRVEYGMSTASLLIQAVKCANAAGVISQEDQNDKENHMLYYLALAIYQMQDFADMSLEKRYEGVGAIGAKFTENYRGITEYSDRKNDETIKELLHDATIPMDFTEFELYKRVVRFFIKIETENPKYVMKQFHHSIKMILNSYIEKNAKNTDSYIDESAVDDDSESYMNESSVINTEDIKAEVDLKNPLDIYGYLKTYIVGQDETLKRIAVDTSYIYLSLQNKKKADPLVRLLIGDAGQGKSYIFRILNNIYPVTVFNMATFTEAGFKGSEIERELLNNIGPFQIILLDEFDKKVRPSYSKDTNINFAILSELNHVLSGGDERANNTVWYLAGAYTEIRDEKHRKDMRYSRIGFGDRTDKGKNTPNHISRQDLLDYGLPKEMSSRSTIMEMNQLSKNDFYAIVNTRNGIRERAQNRASLYGFSVEFRKSFIDTLVNTAYYSNMGARGLNATVDLVLTDKIFCASSESRKRIVFTSNDIEMSKDFYYA